MTKKCTNCGETQTTKGSKTCTVCGTDLTSSPESITTTNNSITVYVPKVKSLNVPYTIDAKAILKELNALRANPESFAKRLLDEILPLYDGNTYISKEGGERLTVEGPEAVKEAAAWLSQHSEPRKPLTSSFGLSKIARELCAEQNSCDSIGGFSINGNGLNKRVEKYGVWMGKLSECVFYHAVSPLDVIIQLVIDDGLPNRPNREKLLDNDFTISGIWGSTHKIYGNVISIILAQKYERDGDITSIEPLRIEKVNEEEGGNQFSATLKNTNFLTNENLSISKCQNYILLNNKPLLSSYKWKIPDELMGYSVKAKKGDDGDVIIDFFKNENVTFNLPQEQTFTLKKSESLNIDSPKINSVDFTDKKKKDSLKILVSPFKSECLVKVNVFPESEKVGFNITFDFEFQTVETHEGKKTTTAVKTRQSVHVARPVADVSGTVSDKDGLTLMVKFMDSAAVVATAGGGSDEEVNIPLN